MYKITPSKLDSKNFINKYLRKGNAIQGYRAQIPDLNVTEKKGRKSNRMTTQDLFILSNFNQKTFRDEM